MNRFSSVTLMLLAAIGLGAEVHVRLASRDRGCLTIGRTLERCVIVATLYE